MILRPFACLCLWATLCSASQPAKRDYDANEYYVLQVDSSLLLDAQTVAASLNATLVEQVGQLPDHYLLAAPKHADRIARQWNKLRRKRALSPLAVSLEKQTLRKRVKRVLPSIPRQARQTVSSYILDIVKRFSIADPLFVSQWHLANDQMQENSINVTGVWDQGITGKGVRVAIVDDGLDMHSDDLAANFFAEGSWDYNDHTPLPEPRLSDDQHGTRCAGEIAAVKNDVCGMGVAYNAQVAGIRILSASISDADEASSLNYGYQANDIYSCSWGPPDDGRSAEAPGRLIQKAMLNGVTNGRGGKGSIFVFASGNGGAVDDQCNYDGYTNSLWSITVGAVDRKGLHPFYSEACSAVMVVTYSSGSGDNIHTTDVGKRTCTNRHGGTSAAAPIAAGIFALVLEVRPDLTWRDMQHLCVRAARMVNPTDPDWSTTHVGRPFNHKYGYGNLDSWAIVEAAKTWELVKPQSWWHSETQNAGQHGPVPLTDTGVLSEIEVDGAALREANFDSLEHVAIRVNIRHERRGNIEVLLTSPNGVVSTLARPRRYDEAAHGLTNWQFMSVKHWEENPVGKWTLRVLDRQDNDKNGSFVSWSMTLWGSAIDASRAVPYKLPNDDELVLPPVPTADKDDDDDDEEEEDEDEEEEGPTAAPNEPTKTSKQFDKPTEGLPSNHDEAEGHSTLKLEPTIPTITSVPAESPSAAPSEDEATSYLGSMASLVKNNNWFFASAGIVAVAAIALGSLFFVRRRRLSRQNYEFERVADDEAGVQMGALESGRLLGKGTSGRTRDLYDAFGVGSDSEEDDDDEKGHERPDASGRYRDQGPQRRSDESEREGEDDWDQKDPSGPSSRGPADGGQGPALLFEHKVDDDT